MNHAKITLLVLCGLALLAAGAGLALAGGAGQAVGAQESASPSPTPTATAGTPQPPSEALVAATLRARRAAHRALRQWNRARRCFDKPTRSRPRLMPGYGADEAAWLAARDSYRSLRLDYKTRFHRLRYLMRHPGGAARAARWRPLALWVGWPRSAWPMLAKVMQRESTSCPRRENGGLLQFQRPWYTAVWRIAGKLRRWNPYNPETNLRMGYLVWLEQRWGPWAATAY